MDLPIRSGLSYLKQHGFLPFLYRGLTHYRAHIPVWNTITSRRPLGTNIFDHDWDLLVILDACRPDELTIANSVISSQETTRIRSVGSMTAEWMLKTFTETRKEEIAKTGFISGNIWSHRVFNKRFHEHKNHEYDMIHEGFPKWSPVSSDDFGHYETVYPFANHDERLHPQSEHIPHICTDRTIHIGRQKDLERMVVHYTLPHMNHIAGALDWTAGEMSTGELMTGELPVTRDLKPEEKSFEPVRRGDVSSETVRQNYIDNIRLGLEYVSVLLHNINAKKTIISADHGEGLGENGIWSHPFGCPVSTVKNVPWMTTIASDEQTYQSQFGSLDRAPTQRELVEHLKAMGYST